jgi:four helix bundle protein
MASVEKFEDLEAWQKARELANDLYRLSGQGDFSKDWALRDQMRRSAISILSNIAEGFERDGDAEFSRFLSIAKGSAGELRAQIHISGDQHYLACEDRQRLIAQVIEISNMISGLMRYLNRCKTNKGKS